MLFFFYCQQISWGDQRQKCVTLSLNILTFYSSVTGTQTWAHWFLLKMLPYLQYMYRSFPDNWSFGKDCFSFFKEIIKEWISDRRWSLASMTLWQTQHYSMVRCDLLHLIVMLSYSWSMLGLKLVGEVKKYSWLFYRTHK